MVTILRVIIDAILDPASRGAARYAEGLTSALIATAPRGCVVEGIVSASTEDEYAELARRLPGLHELTKSSLSRRELKAAWQHGITPFLSDGMIHAPTLLAPLHRHDRLTDPGTQIVVTLHDAVALVAPELVPDRRRNADLAMLKRAERYADAVVVPSNSLADILAERTSLGARLRVIPGAPMMSAVPGDAADRRGRLGLPASYVLTLATLNPRKGLDALLQAAPRLGVPLAIAGDADWGGRTIDDAVREAGLTPDQVIPLGPLSDADLAAAYAGADAFAHPGRHEGFGLPVLEAFVAGTPVVISDDPALVEVAAEAARVVGPGDDWADVLRAVGEEATITEQLVVAGQDRARAFTWRTSAEITWQLHADL